MRHNLPDSCGSGCFWCSQCWQVTPYVLFFEQQLNVIRPV
ncbi:hypothetical protein I552_9865 [Mycobacterium xenopi 3993]|nr:hypothetical protein I552_9865 [Mycobacterium xenopi 3993]